MKFRPYSEGVPREPQDWKARIREELSKLSPEDRQAAEELRHPMSKVMDAERQFIEDLRLPEPELAATKELIKGQKTPYVSETIYPEK